MRRNREQKVRCSVYMSMFSVSQKQWAAECVTARVQNWCLIRDFLDGFHCSGGLIMKKCPMRNLFIQGPKEVNVSICRPGNKQLCLFVLNINSEMTELLFLQLINLLNSFCFLKELCWTKSISTMSWFTQWNIHLESALSQSSFQPRPSIWGFYCVLSVREKSNRFTFTNEACVSVCLSA